MPTENILDDSRFIKAITFVLMASMLVLSMMAGAAQGYSSKKSRVVSEKVLAEDIIKLNRGSNVVMKDVEASNGAIHVIDNVILPLN